MMPFENERESHSRTNTQVTTNFNKRALIVIIF